MELEGEMEFPNIGNPDGCQNKGISGEAKRIVVKIKGIAKLGQTWVAKDPGPSRTSPAVKKSGVGQFEWSSTTLVSVAKLFY